MVEMSTSHGLQLRFPQVIPSNRLFYASASVGDSPYAVTVSPHKPSQPLDLSLIATEWNEVVATFLPPLNNGGEDVESYKVEWWPSTAGSTGYGVPEVQSLKIGDGIDGESLSGDTISLLAILQITLRYGRPS